ncbi:hypothetical protein LJC34_05760 [Oscillospiraceae bacterium OttesenSCG-928-G22]|nr:hypothetical protein [Christensenellaceae bacterium OttesenSCG-928-M15]MDL2274028.1 hypothetical protein [Oscillospiraceae bacterium OttesenSCG-928-G22]
MVGKIRIVGVIIAIVILMTACSSDGLSIKSDSFTLTEAELQDLSPDMFVNGATDIVRDARLDIIVDEDTETTKKFDSSGSLIAVEGLAPGEYQGVITSGGREVTFRVIVE